MGKYNFFSKSIRAKLVSLFLAVSGIPVIILGYVVVNSGVHMVKESFNNKLEVLANYKADEIISSLNMRFRDMNVFSDIETTISYYEGLKDAKDDDYNKLSAEADRLFRKVTDNYGFEDVILISPERGKIVYSLQKKKIVNKLLSNKENINTSLAKLLNDVVSNGNVSFTDFSKDNVSGKYKMYMGAPLFNKAGQLFGVIALKVGTDKISNIMAHNLGFDSDFKVYIAAEKYTLKSDDEMGREYVFENNDIKADNNLPYNKVVNTTNYDKEDVFIYKQRVGLKDKLDSDFEWVVISEINKTDAMNKADYVKKEILILGTIMVVLVLLLAFILSRYVTKPILKLTEVAKIFSEGNLNCEFEINQEDEIGNLAASIKVMQTNLKKQFGEITEMVNVLFSSSSEIMATVSQLASSASETATAVSETTSTVEEVKQTVDMANQKATEIAESAHTIAEVSQEGTQSIAETIDGMNKIKEQMGSIASIVIQLSEKSRTIGEIASTVSDLAEQSNLLAVNAAIEAAKAGEQGKGFSVVAQEIKNLADRSKESTVQIRKILLEIQKEISSAVMATEQGGRVIEDGLRLSSKANEVINTLADNIDMANQANLQIASSSQQQLIGMDQITMAMENIKEASSQTAISTKQSEESVVELNKLGEKLLSILKQYKLK